MYSTQASTGALDACCLCSATSTSKVTSWTRGERSSTCRNQVSPVASYWTALDKITLMTENLQRKILPLSSSKCTTFLRRKSKCIWFFKYFSLSANWLCLVNILHSITERTCSCCSLITLQRIWGGFVSPCTHFQDFCVHLSRVVKKAITGGKAWSWRIMDYWSLCSASAGNYQWHLNLVKSHSISPSAERPACVMRAPTQ